MGPGHFIGQRGYICISHEKKSLRDIDQQGIQQRLQDAAIHKVTK
jgi:hypothetical protein